MVLPVTPDTIAARFPTVYNRFPQSSVDDFINAIIVEAYQINWLSALSGDPVILGRAVQFYVASEMQKELDRAAITPGAQGLISSRSSPGEYSVSYGTQTTANENWLDVGKNQYEIELDRMFRTYGSPFQIG